MNIAVLWCRYSIRNFCNLRRLWVSDQQPICEISFICSTYVMFVKYLWSGNEITHTMKPSEEF
jgi:hypothetical protein